MSIFLPPILVYIQTACSPVVPYAYKYSSVRFPIYFLWEKATRSPAAATVFMAALFAVSCVALNAVHQTASRLTWSFARDDALFDSHRLARVSPSLGVPVYALVSNGIVVLLVGIVYVASSTGSLLSSSILGCFQSYSSLLLTGNSVQRVHINHRHRRPTLLRRPCRSSFGPSRRPVLLAFNSTVPAACGRGLRVQCPVYHLGRGAADFLLLSGYSAGEGRRHEYAFVSITF